MERSESILNLSKAMLAAQKKIESAVKDSKNPFFRSSYADFNAVMEACKSHLNDAGIVVSQLVDSTDSGDFLTTLFIHSESGEYLSSKMRLQNIADGMQAYGSAVTYARRYSLQAMGFIGAEDDDANAATGKKEQPKTEKKSTRVEPKPETSTATHAADASPGSPDMSVKGTAATPPTFSKKAVTAAKTIENNESQWD